MTPFFTIFRKHRRRSQKLVYKILPPLMIVLYGDLHIILKPRNVKICEHSIFQSIVKKKTSNARRFLSTYA